MLNVSRRRLVRRGHRFTWAAPQLASKSVIPAKQPWRIHPRSSPYARRRIVARIVFPTKISAITTRGFHTRRERWRDQPVAIDAVVDEIVDVEDGVDPDATLSPMPGWRKDDIHQKNISGRGAFLRPARRAGESIP